MKRCPLIVVAACVLGTWAAVRPATAQPVKGVLAGSSRASIYVDSARMMVNGSPYFRTTSGWTAAMNGYDTFSFSGLNEMPGTAIFYSRLNGTAPLTLTLYNVVDDSWYEYEVAPPAPRIKLQLHPGVADEAGAARPALAVAVSPRLARTSVMVRAEVAEAGVRGAARVYDAAGVPVREFALSTSKGILSARWDLTDAAGNRVSPGIYYCQVSAGSARGVAKVIVTQ